MHCTVKKVLGSMVLFSYYRLTFHFSDIEPSSVWSVLDAAPPPPPSPPAHPTKIPHARGAWDICVNIIDIVALSLEMQGEYHPIHFRWHAPLAQSPTSLYKLLLPRDGSNWNEIYCLFEDKRNPTKSFEKSV